MTRFATRSSDDEPPYDPDDPLGISGLGEVPSLGATAGAALDRTAQSPLANLRRRVALTYKYLGLRAILYRAITFPLRFTPLKRHLRLGPKAQGDQAAALRWYRVHGRPVSIAMPRT